MVTDSTTRPDQTLGPNAAAVRANDASEALMTAAICRMYGKRVPATTGTSATQK